MSKDNKDKDTGKEPKGPANVNEAVEFYSKKWGVSEEEAAEKIQKLLEERKAPSMEDLFPEPLGELSRKVQDINQAVLSTAFTRKKVAEMENPQKSSGVQQDIDEAVHTAGREIITQKLTATDPIRLKIDEALGELVGDAIKEKLKGTNKEELRVMLDGLFDEFGEKVVKPLYEKVTALEKEKGKEEQSMSEVVDLVTDAEKKYKDFLEKRGFKVESVNITRDSVEKMIHDAVATQKQEWEKESGTQVEVEKERIQATEKILTGVTDRVFDIFLEPIKGKIQEALEKGAFARKQSGA